MCGPRTLLGVYPMRTKPAQGYQALGVGGLTIGYAPGRIPIDT